MRLSDKTRLKEKRCMGQGDDYIPWIKVREISSNGTSAIVTNWKNGRRVHLLSVAEYDVFYTMNFRDDVIDIREQYALLDKDRIKQIAEDRKIKRPASYMSTDLLLTTKNGLEAISVKSNKDSLKNKRRELERLILEKEYWIRQNIPYRIVFGDDMNKTEVRNIRLCSEIYKPEYIEDDFMAIKFLIIHKLIKPDLKTKNINLIELSKIYEKEVNALYEGLSRKQRPNWDRDKNKVINRDKSWRSIYYR